MFLFLTDHARNSGIRFLRGFNIFISPAIIIPLVITADAREISIEDSPDDGIITSFPVLITLFSFKLVYVELL